MSYSRRQLEALGEPFGNDATRVKPGGHGRIYGFGGGGGGGGDDGGDGGGGRGGVAPSGPQPGQYADTGRYTRYTGTRPLDQYKDDYYYVPGNMGGGGYYMVKEGTDDPSSSAGAPPNLSSYTPTSSVPTSPYASGFLGRTPFTGQAYNPFYEGLRSPDMIRGAYRNILGREPDAGGFNYYAGEMGRGLTGQGLVSRMTESPEFQRSQDYQRAYTSAFRPGYQEFGPSGQYYQPIYQSSYTNYSRSPDFYQPSYGARMMSPQQMGYGFGSFNPFAYGGMGGQGFGGYSSGDLLGALGNFDNYGASGGRGGVRFNQPNISLANVKPSRFKEGGETEEDEGIAALGNR